MEAKALVAEMQAEHVSSLYVADDGQRYGASLALEVRAAATAAGLTVAARPGLGPGRLLRRQSGQRREPRRRRPTSSIRPPRRAQPSSCSRPRACTTRPSRPDSAPPRSSGCVVSSPGFTPGKLPPAGSTVQLGLQLGLPPRSGASGRVRVRGDEGRDRRPAVRGPQRRQPRRRRQQLPLAEADRAPRSATTRSRAAIRAWPRSCSPTCAPERSSRSVSARWLVSRSAPPSAVCGRWYCVSVTRMPVRRRFARFALAAVRARQ